MKLCSACTQELLKESFSKKQWQLKQHQRRCKVCIAANRESQLEAPEPKGTTKTSTEKIDTPAIPKGVSCWICLDEGPDEKGHPLRRNCSCRGNAGYLHTSCVVKYAEQKSHDSYVNILKKSKGPIDLDALIDKFMEPWIQCPNCHQQYQDEVGLDILTQFEPYMNGESGFRYPETEMAVFTIQALSVKVNLAYYLSTKDAEDIAKQFISSIQQFRANSMSPHDWTVRMAVLESNAYNVLGLIELEVGSKSAIPHLEKARDLYIQRGFFAGAAVVERKIALAKSKSVGTAISNEEAMTISGGLYETVTGEFGDESSESLLAAMDYVRDLKANSHGVAAERLGEKISLISHRIHGVDHDLTKMIDSIFFETCKRRFVFLPNSGACEALRYEENGARCVLYGPFLKPRIIEKEKTFSVDSNRVYPVSGTPVVCNDSKNIHLNGKIGDLRRREGGNGLYEIHFEDKSLHVGSCLVDRKNLRIVFDLPDP